MTMTENTRTLIALAAILAAAWLLAVITCPPAKAERWVINYLNEDGVAFLPDSTQIEIYRPNGASWTLMASYYTGGVAGLSIEGASVFADYQADAPNYAGEWYYNVITFTGATPDTTTFWKTIVPNVGQIGNGVRLTGYTSAGPSNARTFFKGCRKARPSRSIQQG